MKLKGYWAGLELSTPRVIELSPGAAYCHGTFILARIPMRKAHSAIWLLAVSL
jgi:hypothetical protein